MLVAPGPSLSARPIVVLAQWTAVLLGLVGPIAPAPAQTAPGATPEAFAAPPIGMKGWTYQKGPPGMHTFNCNPPTCSSASTIVYRLLPPVRPMTFDQYRSTAAPATKDMEKIAPPGTRIELLGTDDDSKPNGDTPLRLFKTRRAAIAADGSRKYMISGYMFGPRYTASIMSSAGNEKSAETNFMQFAAPLYLLVNDKLEKRP
jgi:hypothetical protein